MVVMGSVGRKGSVRWLHWFVTVPKAKGVTDSGDRGDCDGVWS